MNTAEWGEYAVKLCHRERPDLMILDIRLPDIDGFEMLRRLPGAPLAEDIPVAGLLERVLVDERLG
jgi:putative two-component system response regulator